VVDLTIIIVSWNVRDLLRRCLQSISEQGKPAAPGNETWLMDHGSWETIVVDNASSDGSAEMIRREFPQVRLITNDENRGFTAANNQGLALGQGRYRLPGGASGGWCAGTATALR
jgi:GT2 family glycosyltransferase